jgi:hypothetical protein
MDGVETEPAWHGERRANKGAIDINDKRLKHRNPDHEYWQTQKNRAKTRCYRTASGHRHIGIDAMQTNIMVRG